MSRSHDTPGGGICLVAAVMFMVVWATCYLLIRGCGKADAATAWEAQASRILVDSSVSAVKRDLVRQAVAHRSQPFRAHIVYYHPAEGGANWRRWSRTATGTLVRPGVSSCTQAYRSRWLGAWVWFRGHGVTHCEDTFPESSSPVMFDLAVWAQPGQSYADWLTDPTRALIARNLNLWTDAILLKPKGGWPQ